MNLIEKIKLIPKRRILIIFFLVFSLLTGIILLLNQRQIQPDEETPIVQPTSFEIQTTPVGVGFKVVKILPENNAKYVLDDTKVEIVFDKRLFEEEKNKLNITFDPKTEFTTQWQNNIKLTITPTNLLVAGTTYTITLNFENRLFYSFKFTTNEYSSASLQKQTSKQAADDLLFGQALTKIHENYPWYKNLPIDKKDYTATYNFDRGEFRIRIKVENPSDEKKQEIINSALKDLRNIGVKESDLKYYTIP